MPTKSRIDWCLRHPFYVRRRFNYFVIYRLRHMDETGSDSERVNTETFHTYEEAKKEADRLNATYQWH